MADATPLMRKSEDDPKVPAKGAKKGVNPKDPNTDAQPKGDSEVTPSGYVRGKSYEVPGTDGRKLTITRF